MANLLGRPQLGIFQSTELRQKAEKPVDSDTIASLSWPQYYDAYITLHQNSEITKTVDPVYKDMDYL